MNKATASFLFDNIVNREEVIVNLKNHFNVGEPGKFYKVSCVHPEHDDTNPSATIKFDDRGILFTCFACGEERKKEIRDILINLLNIKESQQKNSSAPGCTLSDLFPPELHKGLTELGVIERELGGHSVVSFPVKGKTETYYHNRICPQGKNKWRADAGAKLSEALFYAIHDRPSRLILCESPVDAASLYLLGYSSVACCGKANVAAFYSLPDDLKDVEIFVWEEPDAKEFGPNVAGILNRRIFVIRPWEIKDAHRILIDCKFSLKKARKEVERLLSEAGIWWGKDGTHPHTYLTNLFISEHGELIRKTKLGLFIFNGKCWTKFDGKGNSFSYYLVEAFLQRQLEKEKGNLIGEHACKLLGVHNIERFHSLVMKKIREEEKILDSSDYLETAYYISVRNGVVDLRSGELLPHNSKYLLISSLDVEYQKGAKKDLWLSFLRRIFDNNDRMINYMKLVLGSFLVGVPDRKIYVFFGLGKNGKTTLINVIQRILSSTYAPTISRELVSQGSNDRDHLNKYLKLANARVVFCDDLNREVRNADIIKAISGGSGMSGRELFSSRDITFTTRAKVVIGTNTILELGEANEAIQSRLVYVPFLATITKEEEVSNFDVILYEEERDGIFEWLVEGAVEYLKRGGNIEIPEEVEAKTKQILGDIDFFGEFLETCCEKGTKHREPIDVLYKAYIRWLETYDPNMRPMSKKAFSKELTNRGYDTKKVGSVRYKLGIKLKQSNNDDQPPEEPPLPDSDPPTNPPEPPDQPPPPYQPPPPDQPPPQDVLAQAFEIIPEVLEEAPFDGETINQTQYEKDDAEFYFRKQNLPPDYPLAIDIETTGLNPRKDKIRLVSLASEVDGRVISAVFEWNEEIKSLVQELISGRVIVGFNLLFDLQFLAHNGINLKRCEFYDCMLASQVILANGSRPSLKEAAKVFLGEEIDKAEQRGDWTGVLTEAQKEYAKKDAEITWKLYKKLKTVAFETNLEKIVRLENLVLPAILEMSLSGVRVDENGWQAFCDELKERRQLILNELNEIAKNSGLSEINWNSPHQVKKLFEARGVQIDSTKEEVLKTLNDELAQKLLEFRKVEKLLNAFGDEWLKNLEDGVCYPSWHQIGAATGRMACSNPNLQQLPRGSGHRKFIVPRPGHRFIVADYSQIELRLAAAYARDERMMAAYKEGKDLHRLTASLVTGKAEEDITKEDRQLAKAINFGLIYGMSAAGLVSYAKTAYGVDMDLWEAEQYRAAFFRAYQGLARWHAETNRKFFNGDRTAKTILGRVRRDCSKVTEMLNTPIQGSGADGLKLALVMLMREKPGDMRLVLAVHDEIVVEVPEEKAEEYKIFLKKKMLDGMQLILKTVPVEVEAVISDCWEK